MSKKNKSNDRARKLLKDGYGLDDSKIEKIIKESDRLDDERSNPAPEWHDNTGEWSSR